MASLNIATFNCHGINSDSTISEIYEMVHLLHIDILLVQETYISGVSQARRVCDRLGCTGYFSYGQPKSKGVGILFFTTTSLTVLKYDYDLDGRFICMDVSISNTRLRIISVYCPTICSERTAFIPSLDKYLCHPNVILGGDFNCIYDSKIDKLGGNPERGTTGSNELTKLCQDFKLADAFRVLYPHRLCTTWHDDTRGISTRLYHFYISDIFKLFSQTWLFSH